MVVSCVAACETNGVELEGIWVKGKDSVNLCLNACVIKPAGVEGATLNPSDEQRPLSHWIVELGEIESTFKKSDIDQLKAL